MISRVSGTAASSAQLKEAVKRLHDDEVMSILRNLSMNLGRRITALQKIASELETKRDQQVVVACKHQQAEPVKPLVHEPIPLDSTQPPPQMIHELMAKQGLSGRTISERV